MVTPLSQATRTDLPEPTYGPERERPPVTPFFIPEDVVAPTVPTTTPGLVVGNPLAHAGEVSTPDISTYIGRATGYRPPIMMIGDSLTVGAYAWFKKRKVTWEISAVSGRDVSTLPYYIRDRLTNPSVLTHLVIALGTNATQGWTKADYKAAALLVPADTKVIFVTTYRDPAKFPSSLADYRRRAVIQPHYSAWMKEIARERAHTSVVDWRAYIEPRRKTHLVDGAHPTELGKQAYSYYVVQGVKNAR